ncbi:hypothetical protein [Bradyrhizobium sp. RDM4]|uniref:hypothetical protein n=1 Tax=Bradyrhizobium sp. RDM4 TaxID=3378765 RepID=UPI0038FC7D3E
MADRDDERPGPLALHLMAKATINELHDDAAELAALWAELDQHQRERMLVLLFGPEASGGG